MDIFGGWGVLFNLLQRRRVGYLRLGGLSNNFTIRLVDLGAPILSEGLLVS